MILRELDFHIDSPELPKLDGKREFRLRINHTISSHDRGNQEIMKAGGNDICATVKFRGINSVLSKFKSYKIPLETQPRYVYAQEDVVKALKWNH